MDTHAPPPDQVDATVLLGRVENGDARAAERLFPIVYDELRRRAGSYLRSQPSNHTLQPTALVHEAYVKMIRAPSDAWENRAHFCAVAARAMRQILIDHARKRAASERARKAYEPPHATLVVTGDGPDIDLLALDEAIDTLAQLDENQAELIQLRFFGGLTVNDVAKVRGVSVSTVERQWRLARSWLLRRLRGESSA